MVNELTTLHSLESCPEWWNDWTISGLFFAIESLCDGVGGKLEFMRKLVKKCRAERDKPIVSNAIK